jgi:hypothetical protein
VEVLVLAVEVLAVLDCLHPAVEDNLYHTILAKMVNTKVVMAVAPGEGAAAALLWLLAADKADLLILETLVDKLDIMVAAPEMQFTTPAVLHLVDQIYPTMLDELAEVARGPLELYMI